MIGLNTIQHTQSNHFSIETSGFFMSQKHVAIIGAGPGGLTAGMILARRGYKVSLFEKEPMVGGRNATISMNGYTFDTGPTFLMMTFILREMFREAGRKLEDYCKLIPLDPMYKLSFADFEIFPDPTIRVTKSHIEIKYESGKSILKVDKRIPTIPLTQ